MAPRRSPSSQSSGHGRASFAPPSDIASFKDLLLFEERLKQNAALLRSRKRKYEVFLTILLIVIIFLTHKVFLQPFPTPSLHYLCLCLLPVAIVTLLLFFASGMYAERIGYANRYVPHANRALRPLNMHLNMRVQPTSLIPFAPWPFTYLLPSSATSQQPVAIDGVTPSPKPPTSKPLASAAKPPIPIPAIPPTKNPRGELIFSSRVDRAFRDGYERYRGSFERRRAERYHDARAGRKGIVGWWWWLLGYRKGALVQANVAAAAAAPGAGRHARNASRDSTPPASKHTSRTPSPSGLVAGGAAISSATSSQRGMGGATRRRPQLSHSPSTSSTITAAGQTPTIPEGDDLRSEGGPPLSVGEVVSGAEARLQLEAADADAGSENGVMMVIGRGIERNGTMTKAAGTMIATNGTGGGMVGRERAESFSFLLPEEEGEE